MSSTRGSLLVSCSTGSPEALPAAHLLLAQDVAAVLADRREHLAGHPVLKGFGLGFVGAHDQLVEAGLVDEEARTPVTTVTQTLTSNLGLTEFRAGIRDVRDPEHPADIRRDEPRLAVEFHDADLIAGHGVFWTIRVYEIGKRGISKVVANLKVCDLKNATLMLIHMLTKWHITGSMCRE